MKNLNKNTILGAIAIIGVILVAGIIYANDNGGLSSFPNILGQSNDKIAQIAVDYINNNGLSSSPATLVGVSEESGLVKVKIEIAGNQFDSYVSKDGKLLFPQAIIMSASESDSSPDQSASTSGGGPKTVDEIEKVDNPMLDAYVVSKCPYGLQMQRAMAEAVKEQPALAQYIKARYIGNVSSSGTTIEAMHGSAEATENLRQICIREEQPAKYWDYISCHIQAGETTQCETSTGVDSVALAACTSDASRGVAYAQKDFDLNTQYGITGSPTLILNGTEISEFNFGGRSADAIRVMVCGSFNSEPSFCSTTLNTDSAATSFSTTYASSGSAGDVSCE